MILLFTTSESEVFLSFGYVRLVDAFGNDSFKFTETVCASVTETAFSAIVDGKLNKAQEEWVWNNWLNDKISVEEQSVVEVDVDGLSSSNYSIFEVTKASKATYKFLKGLQSLENVTATLTDANGNTMTLGAQNGAMIDLSDTKNLRAWNVQINYDEYAVWSGVVDFYSLKSEFLWNDEVTTNSVVSYNISKQDGVYVKYNYNYNGGAKAEVIDGVTVLSYIKSGDNGSWYIWKPLHSKTYYEKFINKGLSISISSPGL